MINRQWNTALDNIEATSLYRTLVKHAEVNSKTSPYFIPQKIDVMFNAFNYCNWDELKLIVIGKAPKHSYSHTGLCLGSKYKHGVNSENVMNLQKLVRLALSDNNITIKDRTLKSLSNQGVLLLPSELTVEYLKIDEKDKNTAIEKLWEIFCRRVIRKISTKREKLIFLFLGYENSRLMKEVVNTNIYAGHRHAMFLLKEDLNAVSYNPPSADVHAMRSALNISQRNSKKDIVW